MEPTSLEQKLWYDPVIKKALKLSPDEVYAKGYEGWQQRDYDRALVDFSWLVMASVGLSFPVFRPASKVFWGALAFFRYGAAGSPVTGQHASVPFFRLLVRLFPPI